MSVKLSPLTKIIFLSGLLASGFLLVILACSFYHNYYPLLDFQLFFFAPLPKLLFNRSKFGNNDFMNDAARGAEDFGDFLTPALVVSGIAVPLVLQHSQLINKQSCIMSITGGLIVYSSIVIFNKFFVNNMEADEDALFSY